MSLFQSFPNLGKENYGLFHNFVSLLVRNASLRFPDTGSKKLITLVDTGTKMSPKYIMAFHMRKRFRGKAVMSRMVTRLLEGGLVEKMYEDTIARMFRELGEEEKKTIMKRRVERGLKPWSMSELQPAFLCFVFLIIVSIGVFLVEILLGYYQQKWSTQ